MLISKIQVLNYKSFRDSGWIEFQSGINIITGQNSAGKTALLEALTLEFNDIPHRSLNALPTQSSRPNPKSHVHFFLHLTKQECEDIVAKTQTTQITIPFPSSNLNLGDAFDSFQSWLDKTEERVISTCVSGQLNMVCDITSKEPSMGLYEIAPSSSDVYNHVITSFDANGRLIGGGGGNTTFIPLSSNYFNAFIRTTQKRIYRFLAERLNIGSCDRSFNSDLLTNASNLPEALGMLQGSNPELFNFFNQHVSIIFPQIKRISISQGQNIEIKVWHVDPSTLREDLSFPLSACGTGIGQVLSILFVVLTANYPRIIIIDELPL
jgi:hypothetical protein